MAGEDRYEKRYDIVLIQPNIVSPYKIYNLPFGPLFLASALEKKGYKVLIFDDRFDRREGLKKVLQNSRILFAGMTVFTGPVIKDALDISRFIRSVDGKVPIVWGGPHPTILPEQTLEHPLVDIVSRGEGEYSILELADALKDRKPLDGVKGIAFKKGGRTVSTPEGRQVADWDKEVSMSLDLIDLRKYIFNYDGLDTIHIITSKGCPFRCSFCWNLLCMKRRYIGWSIRKIEEEISPLLKAGVKRVIMNDAFMGPEKKIIELGEMFKDHGLAWAIEDGFRVDVHNSERLFQALKETHCHHISFGAESGSQRMLDLIHKDITVGQIIRSAEMSKEYGLGAKYAWMIGIPGETKEDALMTVNLIDRINRIGPKIAHSMSFFSPYPGSELFEVAVKGGWKPPGDLEGWSYFREEMRYPYLKDMWFYKSIMYANFFLHATNSENAIWKQTRPLYSVLLGLLSRTSYLRWRTRGFALPVEYMVGEALRRRFKGVIEE